MATNEQIIGTWILISIYALVILYFVIKGALKIKSISDYAVGNVSFSPITVGLALAASMTSAATFVINPGFIAIYGISGVISFGIVFPLASIVSLVLLTKSFRKFGAKFKTLTMSQWIGERYKSKFYSLFVAFLSLLMITFVVLICVAITKVLSKALNVSEVYILLGVIIFVFGYMMFGGANSMVYTNTIQAAIMIIVAIILLTSGYTHFKEGIDGFMNQISQVGSEFASSTNSQSPLFRDYFEIIFCQIVVGIAVVCQPHIITKSLLLKNENKVNKFLTTAIIAEVLFFAVVFVGIFARLEFPDLTSNGTALKSDGIIPAYVVKVFSSGIFSTIVGLIVVLGLLSAGLSTLEGLIQSVSSTITNDIIKPIFGKRIKSDKAFITINKFAIVVLAVVTFFISLNQILYPKLSVAILAQNGVYAYFSVLFVPIIFGIYLKKIKTKAALIASLTAFFMHFGLYYFMPVLIEKKIVNLGYANQYFEGLVRNPAIASAIAIICSVLVGFSIYSYQKYKTKQQENSNQNEPIIEIKEEDKVLEQI